MIISLLLGSLREQTKWNKGSLVISWWKWWCSPTKVITFSFVVPVLDKQAILHCFKHNFLVIVAYNLEKYICTTSIWNTFKEVFILLYWHLHSLDNFQPQLSPRQLSILRLLNSSRQEQECVQYVQRSAWGNMM